MDRIRVLCRQLRPVPTESTDVERLKARWTPEVMAQLQEDQHRRYHVRSLEQATSFEEKCRIKLGLDALPNQAVSNRIRDEKRDRSGYVADPGQDLADKIRAAGLEKYANELDEIGYTVIPPELVAGSMGMEKYGTMLDTMKEVAFRESERRTGVRPNEETGETHKMQELQHWVLFNDPIYEQMLMNNSLRLIMTYILGKDCVLSSLTSSIKGPGKIPLGLHGDAFVPSAQLGPTNANAIVCLTPFDGIEGGSTCFIPYSHKIGGNPLTKEHSDPVGMGAVPVEAPRGSMIVWGGNTWHGAYARQKPGLRVTCTLFHCIPQVVTQERYRETVREDMLRRNNAEFAVLMGQKQIWGFREEGSIYKRGGNPTMDRQRGIPAQPDATNPFERE